MLKLYHWEPNANSGKPMLTLAEKGVEYESHYLDLLKFDQHQPDYLKINPDGTIPAMVHGDLVLTDARQVLRSPLPGAPRRGPDTQVPGQEREGQDEPRRRACQHDRPSGPVEDGPLPP